MTVPSNWQEFGGQNGAQFAPEGAYGDQGITHGVMVGVYDDRTSGLRSKTQAYINETLQGNSYLQQNGSLISRNLAGQSGYTTADVRPFACDKSHRSRYDLHDAAPENGQLFYVVTVVPGDQSYNYTNAFRNVLNSIRIND